MGRGSRRAQIHLPREQESMKTLWSLLPSAVKAMVSVVAFFIGLGWASYGAVILIVKAEGKDIEEKIMQVRNIDMSHMDKRFDRIEKLIKEN